MAGWIRYIAVFFGLMLLKFFGSLPGFRWLAGWLEGCIERTADLDFKFRGRFFDWSAIPEMADGLTADRGRLAYKGRSAPNARVVFVDRTPCHLHNFMRQDRPLVLNFISSVDEPFWSELKLFNDVVRRMSWFADFVTVVIGCGLARSRGDWASMLNTQPPSCTRHHYCLHDRKTVATFLVDAGIAGDLVYDGPGNEAETQYGACPERLFVLYSGTVIYVGERGGQRAGYRPQELVAFLWQLHRARRDLRRAARQEKLDRELVLGLDDPRHPGNVQPRALSLLKPLGGGGRGPAGGEDRESGTFTDSWSGSLSGESGLSISDDSEMLRRAPGPSILSSAKPRGAAAGGAGGMADVIPGSTVAQAGSLQTLFAEAPSDTDTD